MHAHSSHPFASSVCRCLAAVACAALLAHATPAGAQDTTSTTGAPRFEAGQWAAEFGIANGVGGVGVMRFRSASSAWLLDGHISLRSGRNEISGGAESDVNHSSHVDQYMVDLRAGLRRYHPLRRSTTAFHTIGALGGVGRVSYVPSASPGTQQVFRNWRAGLFGEVGASYFVTPNLSLGASTFVDAGYARTSTESPAGARSVSRDLFLSTGGTRLLGTLYF